MVQSCRSFLFRMPTTRTSSSSTSGRSSDDSLFLKCEGFNFAGSVKLKAATEMVESAERDGLLRPGSILVESSSGNLGVALSMIAASKGYGFVCVTDPRCNLATRRLMEASAAEVHTVTEPDPNGGLLGARLDYVRALCASDRALRLAQPVQQPEHLAGPLPHDRPRRSPASSRSWTCCSSVRAPPAP